MTTVRVQNLGGDLGKSLLVGIFRKDGAGPEGITVSWSLAEGEDVETHVSDKCELRIYESAHDVSFLEMLGVRQLSFSDALALLKAGSRLQRAGWNGPNQYITMQRPDAHSKMSLPYIYITTAAGARVPWLASQTDLLAEDWRIVDVQTIVVPAEK